jgi:hypothetical protein
MYIVASAILVLSALIYSLWIPLPSCGGTSIPLFQSLFPYSWLREKKQESSAYPVFRSGQVLPL